ncbi:hypothetical protein A8990_101443 [Paenibacillus taihuensis]|uniref:DUF6199 domain-containing protein n=1 Tax=Paenibacillus taihuensis TaxID=1156355 RepID=A0A3D9SG44_9BACL|nr:hypothetical protein [Paenibacillus taihuensis]REE94647.1 hypothetical protein A8990_101443 [Paenibacillus taihuensis]
MKTSSSIFFVSVLLVSVLTGVLSKPYFTDRVFYLYEDTYKFAGEQDHLVTYHSSTAGPVQVLTDDELHRTVIIDGQSYMIADKSVPYSTKFRVTYPNGHVYVVERIKQEGEEDYPPSALVSAAYPDYHFKRGMPGFLFLALGLLIFGWCSFRYEAFQDFMFRLFPQRLMYENPEPSDFYYFTSKVGGIVVMIGSIIVAFKAY